MKKQYWLFILFFLAFGSANSQNIRLYANTKGAKVLNQNGDTLENPFCGGWVNPQFSSIDLNGDGLLDLFVFMPGNGDNRVLTFLNTGQGRYTYYPEYESFFPPLQHWAILVDYNKDGKPDIFAYSNEGGAIDVYKNISDAGGLKFKKVTSSHNPNQDFLCFNDGTDTVNIYVGANGVPAIADFDGDGDIDILAFDPTQYTAFLYKNMDVEQGKSLDDMHFNFTNPTRCWGRFATTYDIEKPVALKIGCGAAMEKNAHGASSLLALDMDNDGDLDLLYGNLFGNQVVQMQNGRILGGIVKTKNDTMITADSLLVGDHRRLNMSIYPVPFLADGTNDNVKDLIVSPMDATSDTPNHKTWLYRNDGMEAPGKHYTFITDNFLQESMMDEGEHAAPAFVDVNGDGLMDMVIATRSNLYGGYAYDHLELYKNIGSAKKPVYKKADNDFASLNRYQLAYLSPTFADIDGDGRPDMLVGRQDGKTMYFKNMADSGGTLQMKLMAINYQGIYAGGYSTPCFAHIKSDTLFDLVMGRDSGTIMYYQNIGTPKAPKFKKISDSIGHARVNTYYWGNYVYNSKGLPIDSQLLKQPIGRSAPAIADIDHDGKPDLVSGSFYGEMFFWFDILKGINGNFKDTFTRTDTVFYNTLTKQKENKFLGLYTVPATADMDGDGYPDLLIGNNMGGLLYYGSQYIPSGIDHSGPPSGFSDAVFSVYPNPARQSIHVSFLDPMVQPSTISISNMLGQQLTSKPWPNGESAMTLDISALSPGIYFVKIADQTGRSGVRKIVVR